MDRELIVIGDRVLIRPDEGDEKTPAGLYLPQGVKEKEKIQSGRVVKTGPGIPVPDLQTLDDEPWKTAQKKEARYFPLQVKENDYAIFLRSSAVEMEYESVKYVIVPHAAILVVIRDSLTQMIKEIIQEENK